ncbi:uncharacterized protein SPPG_01906 [Spizellomyces punctatus DAOM BR117]|uniref:Uncharacterized protein n=1 Tax=Spizellomyces punctatus (strain DAOM BR117) TaxID=645134 RepID=A0A0L0HPD0_SPIPD|nr:uncharacterized protein SPPG_01906 [Spizellomyces punctatus DAOM BR117]KND02825.1 hypothetical protein SPPG_01906 [Spizellomyces punctatus DAOM BR117]|eukprot:XP_016610864.1 hypothetical protein SPPG_01906 [Spizellomyces punctatus DAOM BR117]
MLTANVSRPLSSESPPSSLASDSSPERSFSSVTQERPTSAIPPPDFVDDIDSSFADLAGESPPSSLASNSPTRSMTPLPQPPEPIDISEPENTPPPVRTLFPIAPAAVPDKIIPRPTQATDSTQTDSEPLDFASASRQIKECYGQASRKADYIRAVMSFGTGSALEVYDMAQSIDELSVNISRLKRYDDSIRKLMEEAVNKTKAEYETRLKNLRIEKEKLAKHEAAIAKADEHIAKMDRQVEDLRAKRIRLEAEYQLALQRKLAEEKEEAVKQRNQVRLMMKVLLSSFVLSFGVFLPQFTYFLFSLAVLSIHVYAVVG